VDSRRKLTLSACCAVHGLQDGLSAALFVLLPVLAQGFGLSYAQVGILRASNNSAMMLFEIPSGMYSERIGERPLLVFGLLCASLGYLWLATAGGFIIAVLSLFTAGLGAAFQHALASSIVTHSFQGNGRRAALGVYNSAGDAGKLAFTGLFSLAIGMGAAWQQVVTGFGLLTLLAAVALFVVLRLLDVGGHPHHHTHSQAAPPQLGWGIRNRSGFFALAVMVFVDSVVQAGFLTFLAFLMIAKQVPTSLAALAVVLTLLGGVFGKFGCGFLAQRLGVIRSLILIEILTAIGIIIILMAPTGLAYVLLPVLGFALQGSSSITYGTVGDLVHGKRQSRGFAAIYTIASAASIAGPIGFGYIGDQFGLAPVMLAMAVIVLLPLPLSMLLRPALKEHYA